MPKPMALPEAQTVLAPYVSDLCAPIRHAWSFWTAEMTPAQRRPLRPTTRANVIWDQMVDYARATLHRPPGLTCTEQPGFLVVTVESRIAVRYKKLDDSLAISGIRTEQFASWGAQQTIEGLDPLTNVVAGYQVDEFGRLADIQLVCAIGSSVLWTIPAPSEDAGEGTEGVILPIDPRPSDAPDTIVRPSVADADIAEEG